MTISLEENPTNSRTKGRIVLVSLILMFMIPAIAAKLILTQHWYQSGVTNKGVLIEPRLTYSMLKIEIPVSKIWHMGIVVPAECDELCKQQVYLLNQSYIALGKYQPRVKAVLYVTENSDLNSLSSLSDLFTTIKVTENFMDYVDSSEYLLVDPLGQLVMKYPRQSLENELFKQHKELLTDFRKLLKLSRVG
jgi:hypothetical protein